MNVSKAHEQRKFLLLFAGSRRLSVGALVGLQVFKDEAEVIKKSKATPTVASSYGSTSGVTQGGVTRIRNKTIPIINPMVKSSNWPSSSYKRGDKSSCLLHENITQALQRPYGI